MSQPKNRRSLKLARSFFTKGTLLKKRTSFSVSKVRNIQNSLSVPKFSVRGITKDKVPISPEAETPFTATRGLPPVLALSQPVADEAVPWTFHKRSISLFMKTPHPSSTLSSATQSNTPPNTHLPPNPQSQQAHKYPAPHHPFPLFTTLKEQRTINCTPMILHVHPTNSASELHDNLSPALRQ